MTKNCIVSIAFGISFFVAACNKTPNKDTRLVRGTILRQQDSTPYANTTFKVHFENDPPFGKPEEVNDVFTTDDNGIFSVTHTFTPYGLDYVCWPDGSVNDAIPQLCFHSIPSPLPGAKGEDIDLGTIYAPEP